MSPGPATMPRKKRNDLAVKLEADLVIKARTMISFRDDGMTMAEYLSKLLRPQVERDFEQFRKQLAAEPPKPGTRK